MKSHHLNSMLPILRYWDSALFKSTAFNCVTMCSQLKLDFGFEHGLKCPLLIVPEHLLCVWGREGMCYKLKVDFHTTFCFFSMVMFE